MKAEPTQITAAWFAAASDLGIRVTAPFVLVDSEDHRELELIALIHDFGGPSGTLVTTTNVDVGEIEKAAASSGYFLSLLSREAYGRYDRSLFVDTLNDWGYFGTDAPGWYTGAPD